MVEPRQLTIQQVRTLSTAAGLDLDDARTEWLTYNLNMFSKRFDSTRRLDTRGYEPPVINSSTENAK